MPILTAFASLVVASHIALTAHSPSAPPIHLTPPGSSEPLLLYATALSPDEVIARESQGWSEAGLLISLEQMGASEWVLGGFDTRSSRHFVTVVRREGSTSVVICSERALRLREPLALRALR